eukprot:jgi/Chlat1/2642/Chrsp178S02486
MAATLLEQARQLHEDLERGEKLASRVQQTPPKLHKDALLQKHKVARLVALAQERAARLATYYEDKDNARSEEIAALGGANAYSQFYDRLKEVRDYHRRYPSAELVTPEEEASELLKIEPVVEFAGEEMVGRYLDLQTFHSKFVNARFGRSVDYIAYLEEFTAFDDIPRNTKDKAYKAYLEELLVYLTSFFERTQPLEDVHKLLKQADEDFEQRWEEGRAIGWADKGAGTSQPEAKPIIDLNDFDTVEKLVALGPDNLKEALAVLGLKAGGTLQERAQRLLLTKGVPLSSLDRKHFAKGAAPPKAVDPDDPAAAKQLAANKAIAALEHRTRKLAQTMSDVVSNTRANVEKKQTQTFEEMEAELAAAEEEAAPNQASDSDDEDETIYNPLKLPLGPDGKPIPYWLYKLHGLNQEFKCEICGNQSYWGRRAFERHFKEFRHQHGMRCLGIPNTKAFFEVTQISDAQALWERIKSSSQVTSWKPDLEEEYEDREGNVYNKKTYTDLQRQGLI